MERTMKLVKKYVSLIAACSLLLVLSACNSASLTGSAIPKEYKKVMEATIYELPELRDVFDVTSVNITSKNDMSVNDRVALREIYLDYTVTFKVDGEKLLAEIRAKYPKLVKGQPDQHYEKRHLWYTFFLRYGAKFKAGDTTTIKDVYVAVEEKNGEWSGTCILPDLPRR